MSLHARACRFAKAGGDTRGALTVTNRQLQISVTIQIVDQREGKVLWESTGLTVEGQPDELRGVVPRWVAAVDVESGTVATPEPLAPIDLSDRTVSLCTGDDAGWELDVAYPGPVRLRVGVGAGVGARWEATLQGAVARMRLSRDRACVERVLGSIDAYGASAASALVAPAEASYNSAPHAHEAARMIPASVLSARSRYALRCAER